jgi:cyclophilin family peptidyl-prolyl cis-trans isomerase
MGKAQGSGLPLSYRGTNVHRVQTAFCLQAGDYVKGNGSGGESIYGKTFKDEQPGLKRRHCDAGLLSMGNSGKNSNSSQFFISLADVSKQCDGKHVVFGRVISGLDVIYDIERLAGDPSGTPTVPIRIMECGLFERGITPRQGYWHDPPDATAPPRFVGRVTVVVIVPSCAVGERFTEALRDEPINVIVTLLVPPDANSGGDITPSLCPLPAAEIILVAPASASTHGLPPQAISCKPADAVMRVRSATARALSR